MVARAHKTSPIKSSPLNPFNTKAKYSPLKLCQKCTRARVSIYLCDGVVTRTQIQRAQRKCRKLFEFSVPISERVDGHGRQIPTIYHIQVSSLKFIESLFNFFPATELFRRTGGCWSFTLHSAFTSAPAANSISIEQMSNSISAKNRTESFFCCLFKAKFA